VGRVTDESVPIVPPFVVPAASFTLYAPADFDVAAAVKAGNEISAVTVPDSLTNKRLTVELTAYPMIALVAVPLFSDQ
jgi:hypothetical protein